MKDGRGETINMMISDIRDKDTIEENRAVIGDGVIKIN
jgi:hypothetical protein